MSEIGEPLGIAAGPHVKISMHQARLIAEHLGLGPGGWKQVSKAWEYAMTNGAPVDAEHLKPVGASKYDSPEERAAYAARQAQEAEQ